MTYISKLGRKAVNTAKLGLKAYHTYKTGRKIFHDLSHGHLNMHDVLSLGKKIDPKQMKFKRGGAGGLGADQVVSKFSGPSIHGHDRHGSLVPSSNFKVL